MQDREAKHRKTAVVADAMPADAQYQCEEPLVEAESSKVKGHSSLLEVLVRRRRDIVGITLFWANFIIGYTISETELQPFETLDQQLLHFMEYVLMLLFLATWVGFLYHGPGRPGKAEPTSSDSRELAPALASAFAAGEQGRSGPRFHAKEEWCSRCCAWKPALSSHCATCDRCCYFLDHHCRLVGECVGFKSLRCFILLLSYGQVIYVFLIICVLQRLVRQGLPQGYWEWGKLAALASYFVFGIGYVHHTLKLCFTPYLRGWRSRVHYRKFHNLAVDAMKLVASRPSAPPPNVKMAFDELQRAYISLRVAPGSPILQSPFFDLPQSTSKAFEPVFGEPASWRWLLPFCAGGSGDVLCPTYNASGCQAWASLGIAMERVQAALAEDAERTQNAMAQHQADEMLQKSRLEAMLQHASIVVSDKNV
eukprot:TRINITY_DN18723_c0_g1_i1.p1 TRINITY_DN18723_c0_g1~~TRINITY_DN18723_c0_g1_i1.p1  ORF type:complete len:424 (+),score=61.16 TRINITY_DN18723_c0_g1_i1:120-1391(+)